MKCRIENQAIIKRLKRASGHLIKVIEMIEQEPDCVKVAQQLQAVLSAIATSKKIYIQEHIGHCLAEAKNTKLFDERLEEFKEITKYI